MEGKGDREQECSCCIRVDSIWLAIYLEIEIDITIKQVI